MKKEDFIEIYILQNKKSALIFLNRKFTLFDLLPGYKYNISVKAVGHGKDSISVYTSHYTSKLKMFIFN